MFYGWIVVACVFVVTFVGFGTAYTFAAFFPSLQSEFAATRGGISAILSLTGFLYFSLGALSGPLEDRIGPRWVVAFGMLLTGAGLLLASRADKLWQVYMTYSLGVGLGVGFAYVPAIGAVQRWFVARRGLATGLAVAGIGVGTLVMPLFAAWLIGWADWRGAYVVLALTAIIVGIGAALFIEHSPQRCGLLADGEPAQGGRVEKESDLVREEAKSTPESDGPTIREALRSHPFWLIYAVSFLTSVGLYIPFVHLPVYAQDHGLPEATSLLLLGLIGVGSVAGRFGMAGLADRLGRRRSLTGMCLCMAVMLLWWAGSTSLWALVVFAFLFGVGNGGYVALFPALSADHFAGPNSSGIFGLLVTGLAFGTFLGPALAGVAFDLTRSYTLPIVVGAALNVMAVGCMLLLADPVPWREVRSKFRAAEKTAQPSATRLPASNEKEAPP